jgi:uncharacterized protein
MKLYLLLMSVFLLSPASANGVKAPAMLTVSPAGQECRTASDAKEYDKAFKACSQAAATQDLEAWYRLGYLYEKGNGVSRDLDAALKWYQRAADKGHAASQRRVAAAYYWGLGGVAKDDTKAFEWFKRAAEGGDKRAQKQMAEAYRRGLGGLPKDEKLAREWADRAEGK